MKNFSFIHFGEIDIDNLDEYYEATFELDRNQVNIIISFEKNKIDYSTATLINNFLSNIKQYNSQNIVSIEKNYDNGDDSTVKDYVEFHLEEFYMNKLSQIIDFSDKTIEVEKQFLKNLKLIRVALSPDGVFGNENFATFDYTISTEITDELIAVYSDENNALKDIAWES
ncbi:DUF2004 domain-containing protein [Flavobacterium sp. MMS24-S5]|uniref:DUF2004 domain-containing protein n=1 Tax=Flavobacterium sp. MMS24-S5 TaxID=3416605 RepID=UPI003D045753